MAVARVRPMAFACAVLLLALTRPQPGGAEEVTGAPDAPYRIGEAVEDAVGRDLDGEDVRLTDLAITKEGAWKAVAAAADVFGAAGSAKPQTRFEDLSVLRSGSGVDEASKEALVAEAGRRFGLLSLAKDVRRMATLGDVAAWIERCAPAPVVVVVWSPACEACRDGADEYLHALVAETGARLVALAPCFGTADTEDAIRAYLDRRGWTWRVVPDADRSLTDRFGGTLTPHAFVLDRARVLRYAGALLERGEGTQDARREVLREAIDAVARGVPVRTPVTRPVGNPIPRPPGVAGDQ